MATHRDILVIPPHERRFATDLIVGIGAYAANHGPWVFHTLDEHDWEFPRAERLEAWRGDGILVPVTNQQRLEQLRATGRPFVNLTAWPDIPTVTNDNAAIGRLGAEHLLEQGFHRLGFLGLPHGIYIRQRREAFIARLAEAGVDCICYDGTYRGEADWTWDGVQRDLRGWLENQNLPMAVMASNDVRARQLLEAARGLDIRVPEQLAVLGVDNDPILCELSTPTLSSIELNGERVGFEAAAMLDSLIAGGRAPAGPVRIRPRGVVARRSTEALAATDPDVVDAVSFIRGRAHRPIQVEDVLEAVGVSRATLERKFRHALGHSPFREIRCAQMRHVQRLLVETDWSVARIARASAFSSARRLGVVFREETGQTPTDYRRAHASTV